jgi:hypothetical protein
VASPDAIGEVGGIFIYPCSQIAKTIDFKNNEFCKTRMYEYVPTYQAGDATGVLRAAVKRG